MPTQTPHGRTNRTRTNASLLRRWALLGGALLALVGALTGCGAASAKSGATGWPYPVTYSACDAGLRKDLRVTNVGGSALTSTPTSVFVAVNGMGPFSKDGGLYAFDAGTGALRWCAAYVRAPRPQSPATGTGMVSSPGPPPDDPARPTVANGTVYLTTGLGDVFAFNAANGALRWQRQLDDLVLSSPTFADGTLYIGSLGGAVYALNATTGAVRWSRQTPAHDYIGAPIVVAGSLAYASSYGSALYALDTTTGAIRWTFTTQGRVYQPAVVANGVVYFGAGEGDGHVYAVDALTGKLQWSYASGNVINNAPTVANGVVYVGNDANLPSLFALDAATGALRWRYQFTAIGAGATPVYEQGVLYLAGYGVLALDAQSQRLLWQNALGFTLSQTESTPIFWQGALYLTRDDGMTAANNRLITLDSHTGGVQWSVALIGDPIGLTLG